MRTAFVVAGLAAAVAAETYTVTHTEDVTITSCAPTHTNCPYKSTSTPAADFNWGEWDDADGSWAEWETATVTTDGMTTITSMKKTSTKPAAATATTEVWGEWDDSDDSDDDSWGEWEIATVTESGSTVVTSVKVSTKPASATSTSTDPWGIWDSVTASTSTATSVKASTSTATSVKASTKASSASSAACPSYTASGPPEWFSLLPSSVLSSVAAKWTGGPPADWCYYTYSTSSMATSQTAPYPTSAPVTSAPAKATGTGVAASSTVSAPVAKWTGAANSNVGSIALAGLAAAAAMVLA